MNEYISSDKSILGGTPVIKGTRIPIERVLFLFKEGYTIEEIQKEYDHVDLKTLEHVIDEVNRLVTRKAYESQASSL